MAHHEVVENNVKKELSYSLIGVLAFLGVVLLILISAIVRPAGNHVDVAKLNAEVEARAAASAAAAANSSAERPSSSFTSEIKTAPFFLASNNLLEN